MTPVTTRPGRGFGTPGNGRLSLARRKGKPVGTEGASGHRAAIPHKAIKAYAGNMDLVSGLRLKCSKCGERSASGSSKDIERTLVYTQVELNGFLRGE